MPRKGEYLDLTGQRFGRLVAIEFSGQAGRRKRNGFVNAIAETKSLWTLAT